MPGMSAMTKRHALVDIYDAEVGIERREVVIRDLRVRVGRHGQQRALAHVRESPPGPRPRAASARARTSWLLARADRAWQSAGPGAWAWRSARCPSRRARRGQSTYGLVEPDMSCDDHGRSPRRARSVPRGHADDQILSRSCRCTCGRPGRPRRSRRHICACSGSPSAWTDVVVDDEQRCCRRVPPSPPSGPPAATYFSL